MAIYHFTAKVLSRSDRNTVRAVSYRAGCKLLNPRTGETFDYRHKEVQHVELYLPENAPQWIKTLQNKIQEQREEGVQALCNLVESAEKRIDAQVWREFEFALPVELTSLQNMALAKAFLEEQACGRGMAVLANFHLDVDEETGEARPHCHALLTTRRLEEKEFSQYKERAWNTREFLNEFREQWEGYANFHLKLHGHDTRVDHRSYHEQGIEIEPQPKKNAKVDVIEKKQNAQVEHDQSNEGQRPRQNNTWFKPPKNTPYANDKIIAFQKVQLRNLYRILRQPEIVFDIVTKHHTTFMWGDVQRVLGRYVDDERLFFRLESKLQASKELLVLRYDGEKEEGSEVKEKAVYITRALLKKEESLVKIATQLSEIKSHSVHDEIINTSLNKAHERYQQYGGLSSDQETAIRHLISGERLKCIVGYAGAGKTTALEVCKEAWEAQGYKVYGLAPTGKASQGLEEIGINSTTLHKFLKGFEQGRNQYKANSVFILDEAGMVDTQRFEKFLGAVKKLGVKAVMVGDGAQLQPVEAGPAFRLVTDKLGSSQLQTIIRQKEEWQKQATLNFGKQQTSKAIQVYQEKGHIHLVKEGVLQLQKILKEKDWKNLVEHYEVCTRSSNLMFRDIMQDLKIAYPGKENLSPFIKKHQDYKSYQLWRANRIEAAKEIINYRQDCRPVLEERRLDPLQIALLFVNKQNNKKSQGLEAKSFLKEWSLGDLMGLVNEQGVDIRRSARSKLIQDWDKSYKESPQKSHLMMAYSNRDVKDLNTKAREILKISGSIDHKDFTYTIHREKEDDFKRKKTIKETREFSKGDRLVFTKNNYGLKVKNGSLGTIVDLSTHNIKVKLDDGKDISFAPKLHRFFDQGWAVTIHKSQGATVDKSYLLASSEMSQNLTYVAMTRHREDIQVYGSNLDFWREEKFAQTLSKSGEKLHGQDYKESSSLRQVFEKGYVLDAESLQKHMEEDDRILTKVFNRLANEYEAMGIITKKAFQEIKERYLGAPSPNKDLTVIKESLREEERAETLRESIQDSYKVELPHNFQVNNVKKLPQTRQQNSSKVLPQGKSYKDVESFCERRLFRSFKTNKKRNPTKEEFSKLTHQAKKTAEFVYLYHSIKGTDPTPKEINIYSRRARYEIEKLSHRSKQIIEEGKKSGNIEKANAAMAFTKAQRLITIEGRILQEQELAGIKTIKNIKKLADTEFKLHQKQKLEDSKSLQSQYSLAPKASIRLANEKLRYKERYGHRPSEELTKEYVKVVKYMDKRNKEYASHYEKNEIALLRRCETDKLIGSININQSYPNEALLKDLQHEAMKDFNRQNDHLMNNFVKNNTHEITL